jgi:hypothetical protein
MTGPFAILAAGGIVLTATYVIARIFKLDPTPKNDYWAGFLDGLIIGSDDCAS